MVIPPGTTTKHFFLPPLYSSSATSITLREELILPDGKKLHIGEQVIPIRASTSMELTFNVLEITDSPIAPANRPLAKAMALEKLAPIGANDGNVANTLTSTSSLSTEKIIPSPFFFCVCDIAIATITSLNNMDGDQIDALATWIEGGGALLLIPKRDSPNDRTLLFLNRLRENDAPPRNPFARKNDKGELQVNPRHASKHAEFLRPALGRVAILAPALSLNNENDFNKKWFRQISAFLWRVRANRLDLVVNTGKWFPERQTPEKENSSGKKKQGASRLFSNSGNGNAQFTPPLTTLGSDEYDSVSNSLRNNILLFLPKHFRLVSWEMVALILAVFAIIVGPGEYIILGKLKRRKLTWITFPATCAAFAFTTARFAKPRDIPSFHTGTFQVVDVAQNGRAVRKTSYRILMADTPKNVRLEYRNTMTFPCDAQRLSYYYRPDPISFDNTPPPRFNGRLFSRYSRGVFLPRWLPMAVQDFSFARDESLPRDLFPETPPTTRAALVKAAERAKMKNGKLGSTLYAAAIWSFNLKDGGIKHVVSPQIVGGKKISHAFLFIEAINNISAISENWTEYSNPGIFAVISSLSPAMGKNDSQLRICDLTNQKNSLMAFIFYNDETRTMTIYRRIYR